MEKFTQAAIALLITVLASGCAVAPVSVEGKPGTTFGKIYLDTPEVYSRERLVNDRFQQDAWLREKLREAPKQGLQGGVGTSSQSNTALSLGVGVSPQAPASTTAEKPGTPQDIGDTPIQQFRDVMAYREEVRNEILENQLDDRHDIAGNTLYRLKFDATVIPLQDTSAYAMVEVTITGPSIWSTVEGGEKGVAISDAPPKRKIQEVTKTLLEQSKYARYVHGIDDETMGLYYRAYEDWVRDIDPQKYSEEDILYGNLSGYLDYYKGEKEPVATLESEIFWFDSTAERQAVQEELIALGIPEIYHMTGGEEGGGVFLGINIGLANFISDLREHETVVYTYSVTPKERVQRVQGNTLVGGSVGVSVGAKQESVGASLAHSSASAAQANAIMRQPQVVGYSPEARHSGEARMGWLIGPRYKISSDPDDLVSFRHVPTQHTLTGIISVPSWWDELNLVTRTYWLDENGKEFTERGHVATAEVDERNTGVMKISLPSDWTSIVDVFDPKSRQPNVDRSTEGPTELRACEPASIIVRGTQLWRSTVVTLGGQQADAISVLPNMEGIIATFYVVESSISGSEPLTLWTSEGEEFVRTMKISGECEWNWY